MCTRKDQSTADIYHQEYVQLQTSGLLPPPYSHTKKFYNRVKTDKRQTRIGKWKMVILVMIVGLVSSIII